MQAGREYDDFFTDITPRHVSEILGKGLGAGTKILAAEYGDTTPARTVEHGVRGLVYGYLPRKEPGVFCLPRKDY